MTKDEISKLPTPETDCSELSRHEIEVHDKGAEPFVEAVISRSLEQRLAAAVMALDGFFSKGSSLGASHPHLAAYTAFPAEHWEAARETLAAIRGNK